MALNFPPPNKADLGPDGKLLPSQIPDGIGGGGSGVGTISMLWSQGVAAVGASPPFIPGRAGVIERLTLSTVGQPVGSALTVNLRRNGTTIDTITIPALSTATQVHVLANLPFSVGQRIDVQTTSVGSTTAATGVAVQMDYRYDAD